MDFGPYLFVSKMGASPVSSQVTSEEAWTLARLEAILEDGSALVHRRKKEPARGQSRI
jgi:hypothetical protein